MVAQFKYIVRILALWLSCIFLNVMVITNLVRWYVIIKGYFKYGRLPCFEDTVGVVEPHLFTHDTDIWILLIGHLAGLVFFPFALIFFIVLKNKKGIISTLILLLLEILIRMVGEVYEYLMYI